MSNNIILIYNGYEIPLKIDENYKYSLIIIQKAIYFTDEDMKKFNLCYKDKSDDLILINEGNFKDALTVKRWILQKKDEDDNEQLMDIINAKLNSFENSIRKKYEKEMEKICKQKIQESINEILKYSDDAINEKLQKIINK